MTREEAKDIFLNRGFVEVQDCRGRIFHADKWREACVVISEWLAQEPCEDCLSKLDVINYIRTLSCDLSYWSVTDEVVKDIEKLPLVTPVRKKGRWIGHGEHCENLGVIPSGLGAYEWCSNCDCGIDVREWHRNNYNYCPNCGAEMEMGE